MSCGAGLQVRTVECYDPHGLLNTQCDPQTRPASVQPCSTGIPCTGVTEATPIEEVTGNTKENESQLQRNLNNEQKGNDSEDMDSEDMEDSEEDDEKYMGDEPQARALVYQYQVPRAERLVDPNVPNEAT